jgi:hypothetical protein
MTVASVRSGRLRRMLVDSPTSVGARQRARRWDLVAARFPDLAQMEVVDLGGTAEAWRRAPIRPARVTVVNLFEPGESDEGWIVPVTGDACAARAALVRGGHRQRYDLVFSNSLIEHVGGHAQRAALAAEARELAPYHWVQTPYRYFPVEPHWLFPFLQFLPMGLRARVAATWPLAHTRPDSAAQAMSEVQWTELIGIAELQAYFPGSRIVRERVCGVTKSIVAVADGS